MLVRSGNGDPVPSYDGNGIPIILHHSPSDSAEPALLFAGETAAVHGPNYTKLWLGDGSDNRLLLSSNPADNPLFPSNGTSRQHVVDTANMLRAEIAAQYVRLGGVAPIGPSVPPDLQHFANEGYVDDIFTTLRAEIATQYVRISDTAPIVPPSSPNRQRIATIAYLLTAVETLRTDTAAQYVRLGQVDAVAALRAEMLALFDALRAEIAAQYVRIGT